MNKNKINNGDYMKLENFTVFDVETANQKRDSICSIGIVHVEKGLITFKDEILINPECEFSPYNISIHHITESMVEDKPNFLQVWQDISSMFENTILIAHNAKSVDLCSLCRTLEKYNLQIPEISYICTYELASNLLNRCDYPSFRLDDLCRIFNIDFGTHHNALDDAVACKELFDYFCDNFPTENIFPKPYHYNCDCSSHDKDKSHSIHNKFSEKTLAMRELQEIMLKALEDKVIEIDEAELIEKWMINHSELNGYYPYDKIFVALQTVLEDRRIDEQEEAILKKIFDEFINVKTSTEKIDVKEKNICLSGEFLFGSKKDVEDVLIKKGATIVKTITKKTDILILGEAGSSAWKYGNYGTKYEKAKMLNENGASINIYKENEIIGV